MFRLEIEYKDFNGYDAMLNEEFPTHDEFLDRLVEIYTTEVISIYDEKFYFYYCNKGKVNKKIYRLTTGDTIHINIQKENIEKGLKEEKNDRYKLYLILKEEFKEAEAKIKRNVELGERLGITCEVCLHLIEYIIQDKWMKNCPMCGRLKEDLIKLEDKYFEMISLNR